MKHLYSRIYKTLIASVLVLLFSQRGYTQCPHGYIPDVTAFDTTISFSSGTHNSTIKFPAFDPEVGMVTCVRLTMRVVSTLNWFRVENEDGTANTAEVIFTRNDEITGPGLSSPLNNNESNGFGPYTLDPSDGTPSSGPDYRQVGPLTIFDRTKTVTITDAATIGLFYGDVGDSVTYHYNALGITQNNTTGNYSSSLNASGFVQYRLEFCYCPASVLPLNVKSFSANKLTNSKAELKWVGFDDPNQNYYYVVEVSRNAYVFNAYATVPKNEEGLDNPYSLNFEATSGESGVYYFRIKQVYSNGYVRYSNIQHVTLESSDSPKFNIYPNPSNGIVGIKFDNNLTGQFDILIYNTQGQMIVKKDIVANGATYLEVARLNPGVYWLRLTNKKNQSSSVNQLLIK